MEVDVEDIKRIMKLMGKAVNKKIIVARVIMRKQTKKLE